MTETTPNPVEEMKSYLTALISALEQTVVKVKKAKTDICIPPPTPLLAPPSSSMGYGDIQSNCLQSAGMIAFVKQKHEQLEAGA